MSPENFVYWLGGFFEISDSNELTENQVQIIKDHLNLVFDKKTPDRKNISELSKEKCLDHTTAGITLDSGIRTDTNINYTAIC